MKYYEEFSNAYISGLHQTGTPPERYEALYHFKRKMLLARVGRALGILAGIRPENLLDVGPGVGRFLWPFMDAFPDVPVTVIEASVARVQELTCVSIGGVKRLSVLQGDICCIPDVADNMFDIVTALEVLEHIPDVRAAAREAYRLATRFVLLSVPSKEDDNKEHIHLLDEQQITNLFPDAKSIKFSWVPNHMIALVRKYK